MRSTLTLFFNRQTVLLWAALLFMNATALAQAPAWQWGLQTTNPTPTDGTYASGVAVATDAAGRVYVGGELTYRRAAVPISRLFGSTNAPGTEQRGFVAQATAAGQWGWVLPVVPVGNTGQSNVFAAGVTTVAVAGGDVYAAGHVAADSLRVGNQYYRLPSATGAAFVMRLSNTGTVRWLRTFATPGRGGFRDRDYDYQLAADPSTGGVVLASAYRYALTIGAVVLPPANTGMGMFVARLDAGGNWRSAVAVGSNSSGGLRFTMAVGPSGQVALVGNQGDGTLFFGPALSLTVPPSPAYFTAYFAAQLSPANTWDWAIGNATGGSGAGGAAYTPNGTLWVGGQAYAGATIGPLTVTLPNATSPQTSVGYMGLISANGSWLLVRPLAPAADGYASFFWLRTTATGDAVAIGSLLRAQASLGGQTLTAPANGTGLLFFAGLSQTGQFRYVAALPNAAAWDDLQLGGIALDPSGALYVTGSLHGGFNFGTFTLTGTTGPPGTSLGGDLFLAKLINAAPLAVRPAALAPALAIFPSPAHGRATLRLPAPAETAAAAVLLDALGREVRRYAVPARATETTLDVTGLAPGLYLVRCGPAVGRLVVE